MVYTMDEIKPEVKELYDFGIQLEEVTAEKQKLETERDDSLAKMETKIENLMWWDEASKKTYTAPIKEEDKTKTSSTKRPSMLPEGTVVEEKPQKDVVPLYNKTTLVKPDAKPTEDSIPTTSTTAAPAPETKVEEKEVPPKRMFPKSNIVHHFHPIAWVEQMRLIFGEGGEISEICYAEARVKAFMRMLRIGEGSVGEKGYYTSYGGRTMTNLSTRQETVYEGSSASGGYQFINKTYWGMQGFTVVKNKKVGDADPKKDLITRYKIPDYEPLSQDKLCIIYMKHYGKGLIELLAEGQIEKAIRTKASKIWASLPNEGIPFEHKKSRYLMPDGLRYQPAEHMSDSCLMNYRKFYREEVKGITDLYLQPGFLKEFGFNCCKDDDTLSNNEGGWPVRKSHNGHKRRFGSPFGPRNGGQHRGIDMNFGSGYDDYGAPVIATHDGVVRKAQENDDKTEGAGRRVTIQSEDGTFQTKYFHLSVFLVDIGDKVKKGQIIGEIGSSAFAKENGTDCHLHYEIHKKNSAGKMEHYNPTEGKANTGENIVDPQTWIK